MRKLFILLVLAAAGCATTPLPSSSAAPVPADRLLAFQTGAPDAGKIVVTRDVGHVGSFCHTGFKINGKVAARFAVGETATFYVPEGELLLRYATDPEGTGMCRGSNTLWTQREFAIKAGETKKFRLTISSDGQRDIQRTD